MTKFNKSASNNLAIKSGSAYIFSNILINATSIITAPIFSRLLTTSDYGIVSNFMAWQSIGLVLIGLGLSYSIGSAKIDFPEEFNQFLASIQTLSSISGLFFLFSAIIFIEPLSNWMELDKILVIINFVYLLLIPSVIYTQEKYKYQFDYKKNIFISLFNTVGSVVMCLLFILLFFDKNRYIGRVIGLIFPMSILGIYFYFNIIKNGWNVNFKKYWNYALKISIPIIPHTLGMLVLTQLDRLMITKLIGYSEAGLYSFGFSYASIIALFSNAISQAFQPWLFENYKNENLNEIKSTSNSLMLFISFITILLISVGPEAIKILGPENFWQAKYVIMPLVIGSLFQYLAATYTSIQVYCKKTFFIPIGTLLAASINFGLNLILIPIYGFEGAAFSTLLSFVAYSFFHMLVYKRVAKKDIYDDKYLWFIGLSTTILSYFIYLTYDLFFWRYFLLLIILSLLYIFEKKKILSIFQFIFEKYR